MSCTSYMYNKCLMRTNQTSSTSVKRWLFGQFPWLHEHTWSGNADDPVLSASWLRQVRRKVDTQYFWDNKRKIDMVLAYREDDDLVRAHKRKTFQANLISEGLELELEDKKVSSPTTYEKQLWIFIKMRYMKLLLLSVEQYQHRQSWLRVK